MQKRNRLKVYKGTLGLLGKYHQVVLLLVEDSGSEGFEMDDLAGLNGLDCARILKILQELQQLGLVHPKGEISEQRWHLLKEDNGCFESETPRCIRIRNSIKSQGGIQWKTVSKMVQKIQTKMVTFPQKKRM